MSLTDPGMLDGIRSARRISSSEQTMNATSLNFNGNLIAAAEVTTEVGKVCFFLEQTAKPAHHRQW